MLDNLQAQEEALTAMFLGTTSVSTQVESFIVNPDALVDNDKARIPVARLSAVDGIVDREDLSGSPVYLDLSAISQGEMPVNEKGQTLAFPKNGIPYCIPGELQATVVYDGETYASRRLAASQLGITYGLCPQLIHRQEGSDIHHLRQGHRGHPAPRPRHPLTTDKNHINHNSIWATVSMTETD